MGTFLPCPLRRGQRCSRDPMSHLATPRARGQDRALLQGCPATQDRDSTSCPMGPRCHHRVRAVPGPRPRARLRRRRQEGPCRGRTTKHCVENQPRNQSVHSSDGLRVTPARDTDRSGLADSWRALRDCGTTTQRGRELLLLLCSVLEQRGGGTRTQRGAGTCMHTIHTTHTTRTS